ncbi:ABC transporter permease [Prosthecochloris sp. GSB1]|nr:ABC transporter permease [Prosthecochloris sp. GSB1]
MPRFLNKAGRRNGITLAVSLFLIAGLWQLTSLTAGLVRGVAFPTPLETFQRLLELLSGETLSGHSIFLHVTESLRRWIAGFTIAALLGISWGVVAGRYPTIEAVTVQIPHLLLLIPGLAWIPVAILLFGIGEWATVFMIAVSAFAPVAVNVLSGIKNVDITLLRAARMLGANERVIFSRVLIPGALPSILSGLRIGLGTGWRVLVAAEMIVGTGTGLGYSIIQARWTFDYASSFACIAIICLIGLLVERIVFAQLELRTVERWSLKSEQQ